MSVTIRTRITGSKYRNINTYFFTELLTPSPKLLNMSTVFKMNYLVKRLVFSGLMSVRPTGMALAIVVAE